MVAVAKEGTDGRRGGGTWVYSNARQEVEVATVSYITDLAPR